MVAPPPPGSALLDSCFKTRPLLGRGVSCPVSWFVNIPRHALLLADDDVTIGDVTLVLTDAVILADIMTSDVPFNCNKHLIECCNAYRNVNLIFQVFLVFKLVFYSIQRAISVVIIISLFQHSSLLFDRQLLLYSRLDSSCLLLTDFM